MSHSWPQLLQTDPVKLLASEILQWIDAIVLSEGPRVKHLPCFWRHDQLARAGLDGCLKAREQTLAALDFGRWTPTLLRGKWRQYRHR